MKESQEVFDLLASAVRKAGSIKIGINSCQKALTPELKKFWKHHVQQERQLLSQLVKRLRRRIPEVRKSAGSFIDYRIDHLWDDWLHLKDQIKSLSNLRRDI